MRLIRITHFAAISFVLSGSFAVAQQVTIETSSNTISSSFSEQMDVGFGLNLGTGALNFNGGSTGGFRIGGDGFGADFGFALGQESSTTIGSQSAFVTSLNGQPAMIIDQVQRPFVIGIEPVVGSGGFASGPVNPNFALPPAANPPAGPIHGRIKQLREAAAVGPAPRRAGAAAVRGDPNKFGNRLHHARRSSAGRPAASVADIRNAETDPQQPQNPEALEYYERALKARFDGNIGLAKIFFRMAARDASGQIKDMAEAQLRELTESPSIK